MYKKPSLLFLAFGAIVLLGLLHFMATYFFWYWTVDWFDNLMHFLGGLSAGLFTLWFLFHSGAFKLVRPSTWKLLLISFVLVLVIGIGWEVFEYVNGLTESTENYPLDIRHDLIADLIGAVVAGYIVAKTKLAHA